MFKENTAYFILALVAIVLIGITIGLQIVLLSDQPVSTGTETNISDAQSSSSGVVGQEQPQFNTSQSSGTQGGSGQADSSGSTVTNQVALALPTPTDTPSVIVLEPANAATEIPPTATAISLPPTDAPSVVEQSVTAVAESPTNSPSEAEPRLVAQANTETQNSPAELVNGEADPKETVMGATNVSASDDNRVLAAIIESNPYAISFIPYAFYEGMTSSLRAVGLRSSNGVVVEPNIESLSNGQYPLARPLYIYSTANAIQTKPAIRSFISCYLNWVPLEISSVGYFRLSDTRFEQTLTDFGIASGTSRDALPPCMPSVPAVSPIEIVGSSTVGPLTNRIAEIFQSRGYAGAIEVFETGTGGGFERFCRGDETNIVNASRPIKASELESCRSNGIEPLQFSVGADAIAIVVNSENTFVESLSYQQLWHAFSEAKLWSDIDPAWPNEQITRAVRRRTSGTLDFFVDAVFEEDFEVTASPSQPQQAVPEPAPQPESIADENAAQPSGSAAQPQEQEQPAQPASEAGVEEAGVGEAGVGEADILFGVVERGHSCQLMTDVLVNLIEDDLSLSAEIIEMSSPEELYAEMSNGTVDATLCYIDPDDRSYMSEWLGHIRQIGTSHWEEGNYKMLAWANSSSKAEFRSNHRCLLDLLEKIDFQSGTLDDFQPDGWIRENSGAVNQWLDCPYEE